MAEKQVKKPRSVLPVVTLVAAGAALAAGISNHLTTKALTAEVENLRSQAAIQSSEYAFSSKAAFERAVYSSIDSYILRKQQDELSAKYAAYEGAPEEAPNGKYIYGNPDARFTLVEFSDLECPYCKRFHDTPKSLVEASKGNVNWQWKHLPLSFHNPAAEKGAEAAECVAEQKGNRGFWVFLHDYFQQTKGNGAGVSNLEELVAGVGADLLLFRQCLSSGRGKERVTADTQQAQRLGVTGTPATFVVDNQTGKSQLLGGAQPAQAFMSVIRRMMAEADEESVSSAE